MKDNLLSRLLRGAWRLLDAVRRTVHLLLMLLVVLVLLAVFGSRTVPLPRAFVLVVDPEGELTEQLSGEPLDRALAEAQGDGRVQTLVGDVVEAIDRGAGDPRVKALYLDLEGMTGGSLDKLRTVAAAVDRFKSTGKPVVAAGGNLNQSQYYLAVHADELYLNPAGGVFLEGLAYYRPYFSSALEKLSIDWHVFRTGDYKTYGDGFIRDDMSDAEKEEIRPVIDGLWAAYRAEVSRARDIEPARLDRYIDQFLARLKAADGDFARAAADAGLVDELWTYDQVDNRLAEISERDKDTGGFVGVGFGDYLAGVDGADTHGSGDSVGLIVARGDILPGYQPPGTVGGDSLSSLIREARLDPSVRAVVLRIDSGGGSMFASEVIAREIELVRQSGKPMIVSMGAVAASGGYLIALPADEIWAHPTTVTGSIGVFASFPTFDRALERLGVSIDGIGTHRWSALRPDQPLSAEGRELIQTAIEGSYERFLAMVARSRGIDVASVRRVAGGRVWLGETAQRLGLVDKLGSLEDALDSAAGRAGLGEGYRVRVLEPALDFGNRLMLSLFSQLVRAGVTLPGGGPVLPGPIGAAAEGLSGLLTRFSDPRGLYAHCLCTPAGR
jgi:protease-4